MTNYKKRVEEKLFQDCEMIIDLVRSTIFGGKTCPDEPKAFFTKMIGDYYRYIAEIATGEELKKAKDECKKAYEDAS